MTGYLQSKLLWYDIVTLLHLLRLKKATNLQWRGTVILHHLMWQEIKLATPWDLGSDSLVSSYVTLHNAVNFCGGSFYGGKQ